VFKNQTTSKYTQKSVKNKLIYSVRRHHVSDNANKQKKIILFHLELYDSIYSSYINYTDYNWGGIEYNYYFITEWGLFSYSL